LGAGEGKGQKKLKDEPSRWEPARKTAEDSPKVGTLCGSKVPSNLKAEGFYHKEKSKGEKESGKQGCVSMCLFTLLSFHLSSFSFNPSVLPPHGHG